jgi:hypothetical protein
MQGFLAQIESHQHIQTIIFEVIHIEEILINKSIYFNFENMTALCDSNAKKPKF